MSCNLRGQVIPSSGFKDPIGLMEFFEGNNTPIHDRYVSPFGNHVLMSSKSDGITYIYNPKKIQQPIAILPYAITFACFSADGKTAYVLHSKTLWKTTLAMYTTNGWKLTQERIIKGQTQELAVNKENTALLAVSGSIIRILNPTSLATERVYWESSKLHKIIFNPKRANQYAGISQKNHLEIRSLCGDSLIKVIDGHRAAIKEILYFPSGNEILSLDQKGKLIVSSVSDSNRYLVLKAVESVKEPSDSGLYVMKQKKWQYLPRQHWTELIIHDAGLKREETLSERKNKKINIVPMPLLGYTTEMNVIVGLRANIVFNTENKVKKLGYSRPSSISPTLSYGFNGQVYGNLLTDYFTKTGWHIVNNIGYLKDNRSYFFGFGHLADRHNRNLYRNDVFSLEGTLSKSFNTRFYAGIRYHFRNDKRLDFADPYKAAQAGVHGGQLNGLGLLLQYDTRNNLFFPTSGQLIEATYMRYDQWFNGDYRFNDLQLDYRYYFPLGGWTKESIIAIQGLYHNTFGGSVPFYQLPYLTADRMIRGIWHNLYIDRQAIALQGELRANFSNIDTRYAYVLFGGIGDVTSNFFKAYKPRPIGFFGIGLRKQLIPKLKLQSRLDGSVTTRGDLGFFGGIGVAF